MRFELKAPYQKYSDAELIEDVRRVAKTMGKCVLGRREYAEHGRYNVDNIARRFGGWTRAVEKAGISSAYRSPATRDELLADLKRVALSSGKSSITLAEYRRRGQFSEHPFVDRFGSWITAVQAAGLQLPAGYRRRVTDEEYFRNLEQVWISLGRQPSYTEMEKPLSIYPAKTYAHRFGSWRKALEAFVTFVNTPEVELPVRQGEHSDQKRPDSKTPRVVRRPVQRRTTRAPSHRLRFLVMKRDNFACRSCGRSPATEVGIVLHIDHIIPWGSGGETELSNLQTLCDRCNLGKGNLKP